MKFLFLCTHNRCRSIVAEAVFNQLAAGVHQGFSAGSEPEGAVHPGALALLQRHGIPTEKLYSKSWDELEGLEPDVVITVCDRAAGEACPFFSGDAVKAHWGLPDPSQSRGSEARIQADFEKLYQTLSRRFQKLLSALAEGGSKEHLTSILNDLENH